MLHISLQISMTDHVCFHHCFSYNLSVRFLFLCVLIYGFFDKLPLKEWTLLPHTLLQPSVFFLYISLSIFAPSIFQSQQQSSVIQR